MNSILGRLNVDGLIEDPWFVRLLKRGASSISQKSEVCVEAPSCGSAGVDPETSS